MKRILIALAFLPIIAAAQDPVPKAEPPIPTGAAPKFRFGIRVAPSVNWLKPEYEVVQAGESYDAGGVKIGFSWGAFAEIKLSNTVFFNPGLEFNSLSAKIRANAPLVLGNLPQNYDMVYKMRYLDLPMMLRFRTNEIGSVRYFGVFGATLGFRTGKGTDISYVQGSSTLSITETDIAKYVNPIRGSLNIGLGVEYNISGQTSLLGSLVFNNGLTNILKNIDITKSRENTTLSMVQLNLGVLF